MLCISIFYDNMFSNNISRLLDHEQDYNIRRVNEMFLECEIFK